MPTSDDLYITGAGISAESGIPTFRGEDGYWTVGSQNYTPMEMATRHMYQHHPAEFLAWYYHRFITYRHHAENDVHRWLANKNLITQNIDGLDGKAGNKDYIAIHGRIDKMTLYHTQGDPVGLVDTPWDKVDENDLHASLLSVFNITNTPTLMESYKPFVLLFDEYYTDLYGINQALERMEQTQRMIFMGTSFSVNITNMALDIAIKRKIPIDVVDPNPVILPYKKVVYHKMRAMEYIQKHD
ncbi:SIR2 family NAD-dependent protein deacylase [Bermanella sp. R86510]|uniref:SIR2 family NAD-dependent protein deacylase n=1 Tax=unclassified Bermanella TaxID=2627862 RepID=UPI0037CA8849